MQNLPFSHSEKPTKEEESARGKNRESSKGAFLRFCLFFLPTYHTHLPNLEPVVQPYMPREPVRDEVKVVRETELEYDIPLQNGAMQSLTPQIVYITSLDDDYVALATSPILEKHLNKFGEKISDITRVAEKADGNLVKDVK
nr:hypothetical protein [Tanacetum cinerariifolium]